jgi:hypothetical protein
MVPKEKHLGSQDLVFDIDIHDHQLNRIGLPFWRMHVEITDPIGLPAGIVYLLGGIGAILAALGILPYIYKKFLEEKTGASPTPTQSSTTPVIPANAKARPLDISSNQTPVGLRLTATPLPKMRRRGQKPEKPKDEETKI